MRSKIGVGVNLSFEGPGGQVRMWRDGWPQSKVEVSRGGHGDFKGRGGLGTQKVLGIGGHLSNSLVIVSLDQGFGVCRMNLGNWNQ